jgi:Response regulators consisting of a CheY-like receiver domain and a winged-helix DNA-binding domain
MRNVFCLDDDPQFHHTLGLALGEGYILHSYYSLKEFIKALPFRDSARDIVTIDYHLSDGLGWEAFSEYKKQGGQSPVVFITGHADKDLAIQAVNQGVDYFIEKPFNRDQIKQCLDAVHPTNEADQVVIKLGRQQVYHRGQEVLLTRTEFTILSHLAMSDTWVDRKKLSEVIWKDRNVSENSLDTHVYNLKKKISYLQTRLEGKRGYGLRLVKDNGLKILKD